MTVLQINLNDRPPLTHLKRLTTKDGIIQHADLEVPDPSFGYSIDDNARALIVCLWHYRQYQDPSVLQLAEIYFSYLKKVEKEGGSFHNFLSFSEKVLDAEGSEDSIGRAFWALSETYAIHPEEDIREQALDILKRTNINRHQDHIYLRTKAYILLGLVALDRKDQIKAWADQIVDGYEKTRGDDWEWFEDHLCYANGALPHALATAYENTGEEKYLEIAKKTFDWLEKTSRIYDYPAPIGQNGWYYRGREKALYDQQPLDAADMVLTANKLFEITKEEKYQKISEDWMNWYLGYNIQDKPLFNEQTKGVYDALTPGGVNANQGAESIVTFLMAFLDTVRIKK
jgi:uncharacterized protein YyaL (SSP411 family)